MRKLIVYEDGSQALVSGVRIETSLPVADEIVLDQLADDVQQEIIAHRRKLTIERDGQGKPTALKLGKRHIRIPRNG